MTEVNQSQLQTFLSTIFNIDKKYIVLKQGNWFNPQSILISLEKPLTWIACRIKSNKPITKPILMSDIEDDKTVYYYKTLKNARIEMQFVGTRSEEFANSIVYFPERKDISDELEPCEGVIMLKDFEVITTDFFQEGNNTILSYITNFNISWTEKKVINTAIAQGIEEIGGTYE